MPGHLFTEYFLTEGIRATDEWRASISDAAAFDAFRDGVRQHYDALSDVRLRLAICVPPQYFGYRLRASGIVRSDVLRSFRCHLLKLSPTFAASSRIGSSIPYAPSGVPTAGDGCSMEEAAAVASGPSELAVSKLEAFWLSI